MKRALWLAAAALAVAGPAAAQFDDYPAKSFKDAKPADPDYDIYPSHAQPRPRVHHDPPKIAPSGWEFPRNPDRYPSVLLQQSAAETLDGRQEFYSDGDANRTSRQFNVATQVEAVLPVSDAWTLTAGGGLATNESESAGIPGHQDVVDDNTSATFLGGVRRYLLGVSTIWGAEKNPDRWPSLGLQVNGSRTLQFDATAATNGINQPFRTRLWEVLSEERFPLTDWYTLEVTALAERSTTETDEVTTLGSDRSYTDSAGGILGHEFYLVDRNLLFDDDGRNPDRWSSVFFSVGAAKSFRGHIRTEKNGAANDVYTESWSLESALGARLPMTSRATVTLELTHAYRDSRTPTPAGAPGSRTRRTQLGALTQLRYYFF